jgi:hypothetical protein
MCLRGKKLMKKGFPKATARLKARACMVAEERCIPERECKPAPAAAASNPPAAAAAAAAAAEPDYWLASAEAQHE